MWTAVGAGRDAGEAVFTSRAASWSARSRQLGAGRTVADLFRVAKNPDVESRLPYLLWLPLDGGLVLKAREPWPRGSRVFCTSEGTAWETNVSIVDEAEVVLCMRRGAAIDLILKRPRNARSQFAFTQARGRPAIWWQTQKTAQAANPGARIPRGRAPGELSIAVDTREKYGWRFAGRAIALQRRTLTAGDYAAVAGERIVAIIERKTLDNFATSLADGSLAFQLQRLAQQDAVCAVVVEADYPDLFRAQRGRGSWLADSLARLSVRYPEVQIVFAGSRNFAEEWAYRFFGAAAGDAAPERNGSELLGRDRGDDPPPRSTAWPLHVEREHG